MRHCKKRWRYLYLECTDFTIYLGAETVQHAERERELLVVMRIWMRISVLRLAQWKMCSGCGEDHNVVSTWRVADWSGQGRQRAVNHARGRIRQNQSRRSFYGCFTIILLPFHLCLLSSADRPSGACLASSHAVPSPPWEREGRGGREREREREALFQHFLVLSYTWH
jgi:hypothetical protein